MKAEMHLSTHSSFDFNGSDERSRRLSTNLDRAVLYSLAETPAPSREAITSAMARSAACESSAPTTALTASSSSYGVAEASIYSYATSATGIFLSFSNLRNLMQAISPRECMVISNVTGWTVFMRLRGGLAERHANETHDNPSADASPAMISGLSWLLHTCSFLSDDSPFGVMYESILSFSATEFTSISPDTIIAWSEGTYHFLK